MKTQEIDKQHFEFLWEQAAVGTSTARLSEEYATWRRQCVKRRVAVLAVAAVCIVGGTVVWSSLLGLNGHSTPGKSYESVACNRTGFSADHWAQVADEMLTAEI